MSEQQKSVPAPRPHWWPDAKQWQRLAENVRAAADFTILPAYESLVLRAASVLERAAASTYVYLLWLELLQQTRLSRMMLDPESLDAQIDDGRQFRDYMRLLSAKNQACRLLHQARSFDEQPRPSPREGAYREPPRLRPDKVCPDFDFAERLARQLGTLSQEVAGTKPPQKDPVCKEASAPSAPQASHSTSPHRSEKPSRPSGSPRPLGVGTPKERELDRWLLTEFLDAWTAADEEKSRLSICGDLPAASPPAAPS